MVEKETGDSQKSGGAQYAMPSAELLELAYANAPKWAANPAYPQSVEVQAAARALGEQAEMEKLEGAKKSAMDQLRDLIADARASGDDTLVQTLQKKFDALRDAKTPQAITAALASAQSTLAANSGGAKGEDDKVIDLYKDPIFAARMKEIGEKATAIDQKMNDGLANLNQHVKEQGYSTSVDGALSKLDEAIENEKEVSKQIELRLQRAKLREQQKQELEQQMRERGDTHGLELLREGKEVLKNGKDELLLQYKEAQDAIYKAYERDALKRFNEGELSKTGYEDYLKKVKQQQEEKLSNVQQQDESSLKALIEAAKEELKDKAESPKGSLDQQVKTATAELKNKDQITVAGADHISEKTPANVIGQAPVKDSSQLSM